MTFDEREATKAYEKDQRRRKRRVWREKSAFFEDAYGAAYLCGEIVYEGGWHNSTLIREWMVREEIEGAEKRINERSYAGRVEVLDPAYFQCGGCKWFAALNGDWGICCNQESAMDGRVTFEHGGCDKHPLVGKIQAS